MADISRDDPVFEAILKDTLAPYIPYIREWWNGVENKTFEGTTTYPIEGAPAGLFEKCTRSPKQSPIYGIQAFPIVSVSYLTFPKNMKGGAVHLTDHICKKGLIIDEFTVVSKFGINSTRMNGFFLCFIPTKMLQDKVVSRWVYLKPSEMFELAHGMVNEDLRKRIAPFVKECKGEEYGI